MMAERFGIVRRTPYDYWLSGLIPIPGKKKIMIKNLFPDLEELYRLDKEQVRKLPMLTEKERQCLLDSRTGQAPEEMAQGCEERGIRLICWGDDDYPERLEHLYNPPYGLYCLGKLPEERRTSIAIVGARGCSEYGRQMAEGLGRKLAMEGIPVISGLAAGIDGAGHLGALRGGGKTYAVLGCGVDVCYPRQNWEIYEAMARTGGILSEYPPGTAPLAHLFPQRNRLISGLADCVIAVEARKRSGSLITVDFALEQGKEVYAVPGRSTDALSEGTNRLIRQGAGIFLSWEDFKEEMGIFSEKSGPAMDVGKKLLEKTERLVYSCLDSSPKNLDELLERTGLSMAELPGILVSLEEKGYVSEVYKNYYVATALP